MVTRGISFAEDEFYHVYNRGTDKRVIFKDTADYRRFQELLYLSNSTESINVREIKKYHQNVFDFERDNQLVSIGVYCLMPNHFHILLTPIRDNGVTIFMQKLATSYSMYFNKRYDRKGGLFEGTFKAVHADDDRYIKYLFSYIHLNPVKLIDRNWKEDGLKDSSAAYKYVSEYKYSSLKDYLEENRHEQYILDMQQFPRYFPTKHDVRRELFEWLTYVDVTQNI